MQAQLFWVLYDYGQGGLWAVVRADSAAQIAALYPALQIFDSPPEHLGHDAIDKILRTGVQDVEHPSLEWMRDLHAAR